MSTQVLPSLISHGDTFRHSAPIRVGAYWVLCVGCALFWFAGVYPFAVRRIGMITLLETLALVVVYRRAASSRLWASAYLAFEAVCQTLIFHASGDLRIGFAPIVYTFELLNPGIRLDRRGHFLVANGFVALFAVMILSEASGRLPVVVTPEITMTQAVRISTILMMFLCLNVAAFFISAARELLEARSIALDFAQRGLLEHSNALEERVQRRTAELEESYRVLELTTSELRTFIYNITHDLKNPFNAILLTADLLIERHGAVLNDDTRRDLAEIADTARHGEAMLRDLLNVFRITSIDETRQQIDMNTLVASATAILRPQMKNRGIEVIAETLPTVWGQPKKLGHVVANLLSNAIRHAPRSRGVVHVSGALQDGHVILRVQDNGFGISPEYHQRIFELFGRVPSDDREHDHDSLPGTGVGLALVKRIVEDHDGHVWVESLPGRGATFLVRLPAPAASGLAM